MLKRINVEIYKKLDNNWKFENVIALIFVIFGILGWQFNYLIGAIPSIILSIFLMLVSNKFKYVIPTALVLLFSYNKGYEAQTFPFDIVITVAIYVVFVAIFAFIHFKKEKLKNIKGIIGFSILAIGFIIPIFWADLITEEYKIFYVMYFSWLLYLILYVILCINIEKDSFRIISFSFSYLAILITYELVVTLIRWHYDNLEESIFSFWSYIGWGLCNEAGIVLCFILPFIFYELFKANTKTISVISIIKLLIALGGIVITMARGSYLCGGLITFILSLVLIFKKNDYRLFKIITLLAIVIVALVVIQFKVNVFKYIVDFISKVFEKKLSANGRNEIWTDAFNVMSDKDYKVIFGSGIVSEIKKLNIFHGVQYSFAVYHSTTLEVFVSAGIIGLIGLGIHFGEKYKMLLSKDKLFIIVFGVGYLMVDLYGLIDNTYGMYYYMVPLCIMMATINNCSDTELFKNNEL